MKVQAGDKIAAHFTGVVPETALGRCPPEVQRAERSEWVHIADNLDMVLDIVNGQVSLHPVSLDVGRGSIKANVVLTPHEEAAHTKADIELQRVDIARLLAASPRFKGAGSVSGTGNFEATGRSLAQMLGNANGGMQLGMVGGDAQRVAGPSVRP